MSNNIKCKNCGDSLEEGQKYCAACGQKVEGKVTIASIFKNSIGNYLSIDSKLLKTLPVFVFRPGKIAREFCEGKRISYLHPGQLYIFFSVLFFFVFSLQSKSWEALNFENAKLELTQALDSVAINNTDTLVLSQNDLAEQLPLDSIKKDELFMGRKLMYTIDSLIDLGRTNEAIIFHYKKELDLISFFAFNRFLDMYRANGNGVLSTVLSQIPLAIFLSLPFYTLLLWLSHFRRRKGFSEHLILTLYLFGFIFLLLNILLLVEWITGIDDFWLLFFILSPIYFLISLKVFYQQSWFKSFLKLLMTSMAFIVMVIPLAFLLTIVLTILFYGQ